MDTLGEKLKQLRDENEFTLEYVAKKLNTTKTSISRYEKGIREPRSEILNSLADLYDVSVDYLLGRTNVKKINNNSNSDIFNKINNLSEESLEEIIKLVELYELKDNLSKGKESSLYQKKGS